tara:strand:- start:567 stop:737 length:171 start_codon:yes stop_codon:yes gene_type:complete
MKRICKFEVIIERVPMLTPIGIIWDKAKSSTTIGLLLLCWVVAIKCDKEKEGIDKI